eukprot:COSAG06_NODE_19704_length_826_cov_0.532325_1_plen_73_part_01
MDLPSTRQQANWPVASGRVAVEEAAAERVARVMKLPQNPGGDLMGEAAAADGDQERVEEGAEDRMQEEEEEEE